MTKDESLSQLIVAIEALVKDFIMHMDLLLIKQILVLMNPILSQDYGTGTPFSLAQQ